MAKRSRKLLTRRPRRSKSSSRKTMKRTKQQPSKKRTLKKHSSKKRKSRTKSVRKRKKTKKVMKGGVEPTNESWFAGEKKRDYAIASLKDSNPGTFMVRISNGNYVVSYKDIKNNIRNSILGETTDVKFKLGTLEFDTINKLIEYCKTDGKGILDTETSIMTKLTTSYKEIIDDDDDDDGRDHYENIPSLIQTVRVQPVEPNYINTALRVIPMNYPNTPEASYDPSNNNSESWDNISLTNFIWTNENKIRYNRYKKIGTGDSAPRNNSRVVLGNNSTTIEGYINANFIGDMTPGNLNAFIAAMAPKLGEKIETSMNPTMFRFLKMIMEQKVKVVIMVTGLNEKGKIKCTPYWPGGMSGEKSGERHITQEIIVGSEPYGKIVDGVFKQEGTEVIYTQQDETAKTYKHYHHSVVNIISKKKKNGAKNFTASTPYVYHHFWYKSWPDMGIPALKPPVYTGITDMIKNARGKSRDYKDSTTERNRPPILVHCSAGIGRTGTIIGIAIGMKLIAQHIDRVPGVVIDYKNIINFMRQYRGTMVQTQAQAYYMTKVLEHYAANYKRQTN